MERGYVKLWRKTLDSGLIQHPTALQVFTYLLLKTTHKPYRQIVGSTAIDLRPGQVVTGRKTISQECKLSEQNVRTALKLLENLEILTIKPTNKYSVVSFVNWDTYQQEQSSNQPTNQPTSNQQVTSNQPASNQHLTTNKNKEQRTKNKEEISIPPNSKFVGFVNDFQSAVISRYGNTAPAITDKLICDCVQELEKAERIDGLDWEEMQKALWWAHDDDFWGKNVLSLASIRKKGTDGTSKLQKIVNRFRHQTQLPDKKPFWERGNVI